MRRLPALLAAAFLPLVDRTRSFSVDPEDAGGPVLYRDGRAVGRLRHGNPELTEALNLADGLARSPASPAPLFRAAVPRPPRSMASFSWYTL